MERVDRHLGAQLGIDRREADGILREIAEYPLAQARLAVDKSVVEPQAQRERMPERRTAEERRIGRVAQHTVYLLPDRLEGLRVGLTARLLLSAALFLAQRVFAGERFEDARGAAGLAGGEELVHFAHSACYRLYHARRVLVALQAALRPLVVDRRARVELVALRQMRRRGARSHDRDDYHERGGP